MKKIWLLGIAFLVMVGCSEDETPTTPPPSQTGVQITLTVSPERVRVGQTVELTLEVMNHGPNEVELDFQCLDHFGFRIEDADGSMHLEFPGLCVIESHSLVMDPGWKKTLKHEIQGTLAPARYVVTGGILENEDAYPWKETALVVLH